MAESLTSIRELDSRLTNGIQVRLLWCHVDGRLSVAVVDTRTGEAFRTDIGENERPVDVFNHPYAYATHDRLDELIPAGPVDTTDRHGEVEPNPTSRLKGASDERAGL